MGKITIDGRGYYFNDIFASDIVERKLDTLEEYCIICDSIMDRIEKCYNPTYKIFNLLDSTENVIDIIKEFNERQAEKLEELAQELDNILGYFDDDENDCDIIFGLVDEIKGTVSLYL